MVTRSLKLSIAVTTFAALLLAMVLVDVVVFAFWEKHHLKQTVDHVQNVLRLEYLSSRPENAENTRTVSGVPVTELKKILGPDCKLILVLSGSQARYSSDSMYKEALTAAVREAISSGKGSVRQVAGPGFPFLLAPRILLIAESTADTGHSAIGAGAVIVTASSISEFWRAQKVVVVYILLNAIILATLVFFRLRKRLLKPMENLVHVAENYQVNDDGGLGLSPEYSENEIGQLSRAMSTMVERIELDRDRLRETVSSLAEANARIKAAQDEVLRAEKLAAAGRLSAGLAHEIGNPLAIVQGYLELLSHDDITSEERVQFSTRGLGELERVDRLLRQLLNMTRSKESKPEAVDLVLECGNVLKLLQLQIEKHDIRPEIRGVENTWFVQADREQIRQIILNLLINSIDAIGEGAGGGEQGVIICTVSGQGTAPQEHVVLEIHDNGRGIAANDLAYVFEPFFTTKEPGKGTGLGLAVSYQLVRSIGGDIQVESEEGQGTTFRIHLPRHIDGIQHKRMV